MSSQDPEDALDRLIELGHLGSGVGHHVINAFSAIVSNAELLRLDPPIPGLSDPNSLADTIIRTAVDASTVARRLIDYTRPVTTIEPDRAAYPPETIALDRLTAESVEEFRRIGPPRVRWETELAPLPQMKGHEVQLRAMLVHLLENAIEALPRDGGTIRVASVVDEQGWNVLELQDTGAGMDASTQERALEPFFSTKPGHLGIGLSIANGIWRRHRGTLSLHSRLGEGTRIRLCVEPTREGA